MDKKLTKALVENVNGKMLAIASDETPDRDGDQIMVDGWELKNFKANPVLMWLHMMSGEMMPIGRAKNIGVKEVNGKKRLVFEPEFHEITEFAKQVKQMYDEGFLKAFSVGFQPKEWEKIDESKFPPSYKYTKQELVEISAVPIPALPTALIVNSMKEKKIDMKAFKNLMGELEYGEKNEHELTSEGLIKDEEKEDKDIKVEETETKVDDPKEDEPKEDVVVEKRGRVLSAKNEGKIKQAQTLLNEVLSSLGQKPEEDEEEEEDKKSIDERMGKLEAQIKHLIGEVQKYREENKKKIEEKNMDMDKFTEALKIVSVASALALKKAKELNPSGDSSLKEVK